jgi:hypothetical protein
MQAGPAGRSMLQQRLLAWRAALRSLYYQLRHGACHAFYLVAQQVRQPLAAPARCCLQHLVWTPAAKCTC